jgi:Zn finger protein HypA/HybF involved in hydrogenase expression
MPVTLAPPVTTCGDCGEKFEEGCWRCQTPTCAYRRAKARADAMAAAQADVAV